MTVLAARRGSGLLALLAVAAAAPAAAEPLPVLAAVPVSGWVVARADAAGPVTAQAAGAAELAPDGAIRRPLTPDTPMRVASISKLVLALAVLRLADAGRLGLDDDAAAHLGWPLRHPAHPGMPITIRMLLRHHGSLSDAGGYGGRLGDQLRDRITRENFSPHPPGSRFDYANLNSALLAEIVERRTGQRFDQAIQALVLQPLGIAACFNWSQCPPGHAERGASLYRKSTDFGVRWEPSGPWVPQVDAERPAGGCPVQRAVDAPCDLATYQPGTHGGLFSPQGGLRISIAELARLGQALLANRNGFLRPATHAALFRSVPNRSGGEGEETDLALMQGWSEGGLHCFSGNGQPGGDQPLAPRPMAGCGHLGEAYGLHAALVLDPALGTVHAWAVTGSADRPPPGRQSRFNAFHEALAARAFALRPSLAARPPAP